MKKIFIKIIPCFLLFVGLVVLFASCKNDESNEDKQDDLSPSLITINQTGDYLMDVNGTRGVAHLDDAPHHNKWYIENAEGDRFYIYVASAEGTNYKVLNEISEGAEVLFEGKVYALNDLYIEQDEIFSKLAKQIHLYALIAPNFIINKVSE